MRPSPLLSTAAAVALLAAVAGPAAGATSTPAKGVASSSVTLLKVTAGDHSVSAGTLELLSDMLGAESVAKILLTPLTVDGTAYGQQTVTPATSPVSAPSVSTSAVPALAGLLAVNSPVIEAAADDTDGEPSTAAGAHSLGSLSVLGLPVALDGAVDVGAAVSRTQGAVGDKTVVIDGLALPSIADLLGALGLNLQALPIEVLNELLTELDLVNTAVTTANKALTDATAAIQAQIDAAQAAVDKAAAALAAKTAELTGAQSQLAAAEQDLAAKTAALQPLKDGLAAAQTELTAANGTLTSATTSLNNALSAAGLASLDAYNALPPLLKAPLAATIDPLVAAVTAAQAAVTSATAAVTKATSDLAAAQSLVDAAQAAVNLLKSTVATLQAAVDALQKVLDDAIAVLKSILSGVQAEIDALLAAITAVLDGTPLVSFDSLSVVTEALVTSNQPGGQSARVVGGEIVGLEVLGTDVLSNVLGTTSVDLLDLAGTQLSAINGLIADLTGTLSSVLSTVPQFPTLKVPAPEVGLLTKSASTSITDGFGVAGTSVKGLSISLPSLSIPTALALPNVPVLSAVSSSLLASPPLSLELATLSSAARFAPAGAAPGTQTPGTQTPGAGTPGNAPQLPATGASQLLAVLGLALMAGALAARRRRAAVLEG